MSPLAVSDLLLARIPGARREVIAGCSHAFAEERPDEVAAVLRSQVLPHPVPLPQ